MSTTTYTSSELMAATASSLLEDGRVIFAGVGMPLVASAAAKRSHAPNLTVVLEGGIIGPEIAPGRLPISTNDVRASHRAAMLTTITDIFLYAQAGYFDYGFLGAAQIDRYGNINTSVIGDRAKPSVRLPGTGGANDIASLCNEVLVVTQHEPRRFVEKVDFVTSPGHLTGGDSRRRAGLISRGPNRVVTELALLDFDETGHMRLRALQPGVTTADVAARTGFELPVHPDLYELPPPGEEILRALRELDPDGETLG